MRIAMTHTRYTDVGGVERYVCALVERLLAAGHELHYFCHRWDEGAPAGVRFHRVPNTFKQVRFLKVRSFDRLSERAVERAGPFDLVHGFTKTSRQDIYTDGSGCLQDYQEYSLRRGGALGRALRRGSLHQRTVLAIERARFTRGNFRRVVTMSDLVRKQIQRRYGLTDDEVVVIYNGIDLERFHPRNVEAHRAAVRRELELAEDRPALLFLGSDYDRKGLATFLEALVQLDDAVGLVIGKERPREEARYRQLAAALGVAERVRFLGLRPEPARYYAACDLFVLPTRFDAFGMVVLEAMATGIPAVVTTAAGAAEVIEDGVTGRRVHDPRDADELAAACAPLLDREAARAAGARARVAAEGYSWERHFEQLLELYAQVAAERRGEAAP